MGFKRYGSASIAHAHMRQGDWLDYLSDQAKRSRVAKKAGAPQSLSEQVTAILGRPFDPAEFVISHATIVASVDTYAPKVAKVGRREEGGFQVNCPFADYRVTAATQKYANNNDDAFSRGVILKSYRTLIGGQVFSEHVQIEALSKGRIFDAVARDVGDSIYVDILTGTHRSHEDLCSEILAGVVNKMSMGTDIVGSQCAKCGNWAEDDTKVCPCIQYFKGDVFQDEDGNPHRVVDLCGHESLPGGGNTFKEGSWVRMPAFEGAVTRQVVRMPGGRAMRVAPAVPTELRALVAGCWVPAASSRTAGTQLAQDPVEFDEVKDAQPEQGRGSPDEDGDQAPPEPPAPAKKRDDGDLDDTVSEVEKYVMDRALDKIRRRMKDSDLSQVLPISTAPNDSVLQQASSNRFSAYGGALRAIQARTKNPVRRLLALHHLNEAFAVDISPRIYRAAAGALRGKRAISVSEFISCCIAGAASAPTPSEARTIVRVARFLLKGDQLQ